MIFHAFLIKYAEIAIKGKNRYLFEDALVKQMNIALSKIEGDYRVVKEQGRVYVFCPEEYDFEEAVAALKTVFGIVYICPVVIYEDKGFEQMRSDVVEYMKNVHPDYHGTFKVYTRRAKKSYPVNSMEVSARIGESILDAFPEAKVDVHQPELTVSVEIREKIYVYSKSIKGPGGMPVGTNGKAMLLLSGGIDSPVAGYMIAKRGVTLDAVHYHSFPYTSERAKEKVLELAKLMTEYTGPIRLNIVSFTEIQMEIYEKCPEEQLTILMRRFMMKIAERLAKKAKAKALVTGESIGQVASQTIESLHVTNSAVEMLVFRPLIGMDKIEIMERAKQIHTYDTSILPYEDCCTVFVPKHPVTKPDLEKIVASEQLLDGDALIQRALDTVETVLIK